MGKMHRPLFVLLISFVWMLLGWSLATAEPVAAQPILTPQTEAAAIDSFGDLPLYFEENAGQVDAAARYFARAGGYTLFLTPERAAFNLQTDAGTYGLYMDFVDANADPIISGDGQQEGVSSYFRGNDESQWVRGASHYDAVRYGNLYDGIDAIFYGNMRQLQYDFIVSPGADPAAIQLRFDPAEQITLDEVGNLLLHLGDETLTMQAPYTYQTIDGEEVVVESAFHIEDGLVGFTVGDYDADLPLVIDPLVYATYLGGSGDDNLFFVEIGADGSIYLTGITTSVNFPVTPGAYDPSYHEGISSLFDDVVAIKLNAAGTRLIYSTYIGTEDDEVLGGMHLMDDGSLIIGGATSSPNFPTTPGAFDRTHATLAEAELYYYQLDVFVLRLNPTGNDLTFSTYLGGHGQDSLWKMVVKNNIIYLMGVTVTLDFPTTADAYQSQANSENGGEYLTKMSIDGSHLIYSTYISDIGSTWALAVDDDGAIYLGGTISEDKLPVTPDAFDSTYDDGPNADDYPYEGVDGYFIKMNPSGTVIEYATYIGGSYYDSVSDIQIGTDGVIYLVGYTGSIDFPTTPDAFKISKSQLYSDDIFAMKFSLDATELIYSTFIGGARDDWANNSYLNADGSIYVTGTTSSDDFPTTPDALPGADDAFLLRLSPDGRYLEYSTLLDGDGFEDFVYGLTLDSRNRVYVSGSMRGSGFPITSNALQRNYAGGDGDGFLAIFDFNGHVSLRVAVGADVTIAEGSTTASYPLSLTTVPTHPVTVNVTADGQCTVNPTELTFAADSSSRNPQMVTVTAVDDDVFEGDHICLVTHTATSADSDYHERYVASLVANISDDELPQWYITEQELQNSIMAQFSSTDSALEFVLADFQPDQERVRLTVRTVDGVVGTGDIYLRMEGGILVVSMGDFTVNGGMPPATFSDAVHAELPLLITGGIDQILTEKVILWEQVANVTLHDTFIQLELQTE